MKLSEIAKAVNGELIGDDISYTELAWDTRTLKKSQVFIALKGDNFDGHDFIQAAIDKQPSCLIVEKVKLTHPVSCPVIFVEDTIIALGLLAQFWRNQFDIPVIGITGSCGKTTVKSMLGSILQQSGPTLVPPGSFNNQFGLPFTLLKLNSEHQYAVIEVGTNHFGEIAYLSNLLNPTVSMVTCIKPAHLEGFKTEENVAHEKADIYKYLAKNGVAILNVDEPYHPTFEKVIKNHKTYSYGLQSGDVFASHIQSELNQTSFILHYKNEEAKILLKAPGVHNVSNALAAACVAFSLSIPLKNVVKGLEEFAGVKGRLVQFKLESGVQVIDDSYNANPASFKAAIEVLSKANGPKILVMGEMGELGEKQERYHQEVGQYAKENGVDQLLTYGHMTQFAVDEFGLGGQIFEHKSDLLSCLRDKLKEGTTILVKGSRYTAMDEIVNALLT